ncbi:MAG: hypothetical protein EOP89_17965, partial [Lysobacteraceae bacterium]
MSKIKMLVGAAMLAAPMPAAAATIDLSATDYDKSAITHVFDPGSYTVSLAKGLYVAWAVNQSTTDPRWVDYYQYTIDGVTKSTNSFSDVIEGVKIDLKSAAPGTVVNLGSSQPVDAIKQ